MENKRDVASFSKTELKALAYDVMREINSFQRSLTTIENEITKREQAEAAEQEKEQVM